MFGNLGNIANLMKSARALQEHMTRMQQELAHRRYDGEAGGGMVRATVDGKGTLIDIKIAPEAVGDVELLEDLVKAAVGAATTKAHDAMKGEMSAMTGGMNIPGLEQFLGGQ